MDYQERIEGYGKVERIARNGGHSARVFVPKAWAGKKVCVILAEPLDNGGPAESKECKIPNPDTTFE